MVIPTRDRWALLERNGLRAALAQEDVELEVIVVDDGSTTVGLSEAANGLDPRARVIRHDVPLGLGRARNAGIEEAAGTWIAFLDDDDLWSPRKLRLQLDAAAKAGFAYAGAVWVDTELRLLRSYPPPDPAALATELLRWNVLWGGASNVIAKASVLRELGGFDEQLHQLADWDLWLRLAASARGALVDEPLVAMLVHRESMLLVDERDVFLELDRLEEKHRGARERAAVGLDRARFARWAAAGHLRAGRRRVAARTYLRGTHAPANLLRAAAVVLGPAAFAAVSARRSSFPRALASGERAAARPAWLELYG